MKSVAVLIGFALLALLGAWLSTQRETSQREWLCTRWHYETSAPQLPKRMVCDEMRYLRRP